MIVEGHLLAFALILVPLVRTANAPQSLLTLNERKRLSGRHRRIASKKEKSQSSCRVARR